MKESLENIESVKTEDNSRRRGGAFSILPGIAAGLFVGAAVTFAFLSGHDNRTPSNGSPTTLISLLALPQSQLTNLDIAVVNLLCAEGLPGVDGMNIDADLRRLDEWAKRVKSETDRYFYKFQQNPSDYRNSEAYFRILAMVTVLQQDFHVHYNPARIESPDFCDSRDLFLHGLLSGEHQGTCVSMPVLYVAVGRRLGYPLKLVATKAHLFARWESADGKERLNIEATNEGLNCFPDDYYRSWPLPLTEAEIKSGGYLKSLTPAEELAVFLSARGHCLEANGRFPDAQLAQALAHVLAPNSPVYLAFLAAAVKKEMPDWQRVQVDLGQNAVKTKAPAPGAN